MWYARVHVKGPAELLPMGTYLRVRCAQTSVSGHGTISGAFAQLILRFIGGSCFSLECHRYEFNEQIKNVC